VSVRLIRGDCRDALPGLAAGSVHCVVTSPPYFGQRDYGMAGQIGLGDPPETYLNRLVEVFRQVRRVLRDDGTCWLVIGDAHDKRGPLLLPSRLAHMLQADGWFLRADIVWHKPNGMPRSYKDRPTATHEHVLMLTKAQRGYFYDFDAVAAATSGAALRDVWSIAVAPYRGAHFAVFPPALVERCLAAGTSQKGVCRGCGAPWRRVVESGGVRASGPNKLAHKPRSRDRHARDGALEARPVDGFGDLPRRVRRLNGWAASCACGEPVVPALVLDPFGGAGTVGLVAEQMGRDAILIELVPSYVEQARRRIARGKPRRPSP
jgi:DNA modification methylase